ncbi:acyl carrier protein [Pseudoalteromonas piscicida]|uniref:Acyl carrier protein n=1 Tax=Pseudoalteromonas piscicida TaxID=43662 RepID=A0AAD0RG93_PSEO7|nr:phosphopantetheine-binding protein [Pseudoalteromonas piscicida]ASD68184.1 hypothetical protein B1L02_14955 [Pseudoalteromonas piscicida]AXR01109.1 acyl carrier protein [Pseudoalteromonas piscicida]
MMIQTLVLTVLEQKYTKNKVHTQSRLVEDLGLDSLKIMQLLSDLEDSFDLSLPDVDFQSINTVEKLSLFIERESSVCA